MNTKKIGDCKPRITKCDCPVLRKTPGLLINHTLACLRLRRGDRTIKEYYG